MDSRPVREDLPDMLVLELSCLASISSLDIDWAAAGLYIDILSYIHCVMWCVNVVSSILVCCQCWSWKNSKYGLLRLIFLLLGWCCYHCYTCITINQIRLWKDHHHTSNNGQPYPCVSKFVRIYNLNSPSLILHQICICCLHIKDYVLSFDTKRQKI